MIRLVIFIKRNQSGDYGDKVDGEPVREIKYLHQEVQKDSRHYMGHHLSDKTPLYKKAILFRMIIFLIHVNASFPI